MGKNFSVDSSLPTAYLQIKNYLLNELIPILNDNRPIIFVCIGTDRSTGDSLGPLVGYKLQLLNKTNIHIYGTLKSPVHAKNICKLIAEIYSKFNNPYIIAIDSCLGSLNNIGKIYIKNSPLLPGLALNKDLPPIGNMSITGIVNISGQFEFLVLQNTRLYTVMSLADVISKGIYHFLIESINKKQNLDSNIKNNINFL
ncbi:MAG: spore protease YyaC [Clostridium butyricum]|nr:spore protease YyaC [Clostridium butyricum]